MKPYNGFSPEQRMRGFRWLRAQQGAGLRTRAQKCDACGQEHGVLEEHSEDYSAPFGPHIGAYHLCYVCHMVLHCRATNPRAWERYKALVASGLRVVAFHSRDFRRFCRLVLEGTPPEDDVEAARGADMAVFDAIERKARRPYAEGHERARAE